MVEGIFVLYFPELADLLDLSARIIDSGHADEPVNRVTQELSEVGDDVAVIGFGPCGAVAAGLLGQAGFATLAIDTAQAATSTPRKRGAVSASSCGSSILSRQSARVTCSSRPCTS